MILFYCTLIIWHSIFLTVLFLVSKVQWKRILGISLAFTMLNFLKLFPFLQLGNVNWIGNILVIVAVFGFYVYKKKDQISLIQFKVFSKYTAISLGLYISLFIVILQIKKPLESTQLEYYFLLATVAGISEELQFRAYLNYYLEEIIKWKEFVFLKIPLSLIVTSFAFALIHIYPFRDVTGIMILYFFRTFILGIVLGLIYKKTKNIIIPILVHNSLNMIFIFGFSF